MVNEHSSELATTQSGSLHKPSVPLAIGTLEHELLERYPRADAEEWDRMGLLVGDPAETVTGVLVALDPTVGAVHAAASGGANVLLTHHPAFLEGPDSFGPVTTHGGGAGTVVWEAIANGIALMNIHTALDVSPDAASVLPTLLSLDKRSALIPLEADDAKGYGQICAVNPGESPLKLGQLAARCVSVFGSTPRVWGAEGDLVRKVAIMNGSVGSLAPTIARLCSEQSIDCLICGEIRYHSAMDLVQGGLDIIELGHDVSEFPLTAVLARAVIEIGIPSKDVSIYEQSKNWTTPEATRV